jgi:hypothetical protein
MCCGVDGGIYAAVTGGCGLYPMRLIGVYPKGGAVTVLANNLGFQRRTGCYDGPADARSLISSSTRRLHQCPRTGALLWAGWDGNGLRRYHGGFVTSVVNGTSYMVDAKTGRPEFDKRLTGAFSHFGLEPTVAPNGDIYVAPMPHGALAPDAGIARIRRLDWPKTQPHYGYGEKFLPRKKLKELMLAYAKRYIADYAEMSKIY